MYDLVNACTCLCYHCIGILWPVESLDKWLNTISHLTPVTYPNEAMRAILMKGIYYFVQQGSAIQLY